MAGSPITAANRSRPRDPPILATGGGDGRRVRGPRAGKRQPRSKVFDGPHELHPGQPVFFARKDWTVRRGRPRARAPHTGAVWSRDFRDLPECPTPSRTHCVPATIRRIATHAPRRSSRGMSSARSSASAKSSMSYGLMMSASSQFLRRACQRTQNQHAVVIVPCGHELLGHEVHAVVQRTDDAEVRQPIERNETRQRQSGLVVVDRRREARHPVACVQLRGRVRSISASIAL